MWKLLVGGIVLYIAIGSGVAWLFLGKPMGMLFAALINYCLAMVIFNPILVLLERRPPKWK